MARIRVNINTVQKSNKNKYLAKKKTKIGKIENKWKKSTIGKIKKNGKKGRNMAKKGKHL